MWASLRCLTAITFANRTRSRSSRPAAGTTASLPPTGQCDSALLGLEKRSRQQAVLLGAFAINAEPKSCQNPACTDVRNTAASQTPSFEPIELQTVRFDALALLASSFSARRAS
ncbi:hypothetical protein L1887_62285 [Cichorium endivia]|nr:hypothetical protein L1887_62285 [Cichorium endivia]